MDNYPKIIPLTPSYLEHCFRPNSCDHQDDVADLKSRSGRKVYVTVTLKVLF